MAVMRTKDSGNTAYEGTGKPSHTSSCLYRSGVGFAPAVWNGLLASLVIRPLCPAGFSLSRLPTSLIASKTT